MKIFLSHSSKDKGFIKRLAGDIRERNLDYWLDEVELGPGDSLIDEIESAIDASPVFLIALSRNSIQSKWVRLELKAAMTLKLEGRDVRIIPALIDDCEVPLFLRDQVYADFRSSYESGLLQILKVLTGCRRLREAVFVPSGKFLYSELSEPRSLDRGFYIDQFEVTNEDYLRFVEESGYQHPMRGARMYSAFAKLPVVYVNYRDAVAYCKWRSKVEGRIVRLPTAIEWEKAARGTDGRKYPWGDEIDWRYLYANCSEFVHLENQGHRGAQPVDRFQLNVSPYGAQDMAGNVCEWTSSDFQGDHAPEGRSGVGMEVRGGGYDLLLELATCYFSAPHDPAGREDYIGFRCVSES